MRSTENNGTKKGKKGGMLKIWIYDSADNGSVNQLDTYRHLNLKAITMKSFLKRSH